MNLDKKLTRFNRFLLFASLIASLIFSTICAYAQAAVKSTVTTTVSLAPTIPAFDADNANSLLNKVSVTPFLNSASIKSLQIAINDLTKLEVTAKKCIETDAIELDKVN